MSKGLCAKIGEEDLRFTEKEMLSYFQVQGIRPSAQAASDIYDKTEGWAFAIGLAGLFLKKSGIKSGIKSAGTADKNADLRSCFFGQGVFL